jgi:hypothetical protein
VAGAIDPEALGAAIRTAFELPDERLRSYRQGAATRLERFRPEAVQRTVAEQVVPALLG